MKYTKEQHLAHVAAWWDGKLEVCDGKGVWYEVTVAPADYHDPSIYRIRPEPKLRPWKPEEVPLGAQARHKKEPENMCRWLIVGHDRTDISVSGSGCKRDFLYCLEFWEHSTDGGRTWLPCGVEEQV